MAGTEMLTRRGEGSLRGKQKYEVGIMAERRTVQMMAPKSALDMRGFQHLADLCI